MPLDPRAARFLDMMSVGRVKNAPRDIAERRLGLAKLLQFAKADHVSPPGEDLVLAHGVPARLYAPAHVAGITPGLIFFHGGGLVAGSIDLYDIIARALCAESQCRVISVGYRLAPEFPFPAAMEDATAATKSIYVRSAEFHIDPNRIALVGESGGGALATLLAHDLPDLNFALLCLLCPVLDFGPESDSRKEFAEGYLIDRSVIEGDLADLLQGRADRADPRVSPARLADVSHLPPAIIHTAEYDPLRDEGENFAARLNDATLHRHAGMVHNFHALGAVIPQGKEALRAIGQEIGERLRTHKL